jgi:hypothetical protein
MPPCEVLLDVLLGLEALHELDDLQVGHIDLGVLGGIEVLLGVQDALLEEILVNLHPVLLGNQHGACLRSPLRTRDGFAKKLERGGERATLTGRSAKGRSASRTRTQKGLLPLPPAARVRVCVPRLRSPFQGRFQLRSHQSSDFPSYL